MDEKDIIGAFQNKILFADGASKNEVNHIVKQLSNQQHLFNTKTIVQDIVAAYKGELEWNAYLKERHEYNENVRTENNIRIVNFKESKDEYKLEYRLELPILDFTTFSIAEMLGKKDRNEGNNKC